MERSDKIKVEEFLRDGMAKKIFVIPDSTLMEFYIDSATCMQFAVEWFPNQEPILWVLTEEDEWGEHWSQYVEVGTYYKGSSQERAFVERKKNEAISKGSPTQELVYWTRMWEAVKFIRKDRRIGA